MNFNTNQFILTSDFPALQNDAIGSVSLTIPSSLTITANSAYTTSADLSIGTPNAIYRALIQSTGLGWMVGEQHIINFTGGTVPGVGTVPYSAFCFIWRPTPTVLRLQVIIPNPYGGTLSAFNPAVTVTLNVQTFLAPFTS